MCAAIAEDLSHFKAVAVFFDGWRNQEKKSGAFFCGWLKKYESGLPPIYLA
jgi:hypothetical protein